MDCNPPNSSVHGDSPGKNTGVCCLFLFHNKAVKITNFIDLDPSGHTLHFKMFSVTTWEVYVNYVLGWEDPLEKGKATHYNILAWRIQVTVLSMGLQRVRHDWATFTFTNINSISPSFRALWSISTYGSVLNSKFHRSRAMSLYRFFQMGKLRLSD